MQATGLTHIQETQLDEAALQQFCNSFSVGPLKIDYCVDLAVPQVTVNVYLAGVRIGGGTINAQNPTITIGGGVAGFKAEVTLTADFNARQLTYTAEICAPFIGCKAHSGVLFSW